MVDENVESIWSVSVVDGLEPPKLVLHLSKSLISEILPTPRDEEEDGKIVVVDGLEPPKLVLHLSMISIEASSALLHFRNPAYTTKFYVYSDQIN